jgi:hypothetical protein
VERQIQWARPKLFGFEDISLRVEESRAESKAGRPEQTKLAVGSRHGAPSKASRRARQQEPGMNQNASGLSIMAGLTAGVGSRTADCGCPHRPDRQWTGAAHRVDVQRRCHRPR